MPSCLAFLQEDISDCDEWKRQLALLERHTPYQPSTLPEMLIL